MSTLEKAISIASTAHAGQTDKGGAPYILHCLRVMMAVDTLDEKIVAVLHDVVEDTEVDLPDLARAGFSEKVNSAISALTKYHGESRIQAAHRAAKNKIARVVKLADNKDNSDLSRIPNPTAHDMARLEEYAKVREILLSFKVPESELAEKFVEKHCEANSQPFKSLKGHVQLALNAGCSYIEIREAIEQKIDLYEYSQVRLQISHKLALEAASLGFNLRHLGVGLKTLLEGGSSLESAYSKLNIAHSKGYDVLSYAVGVVCGCTEDDIKECVDAKLSLQFYVNLRKYGYGSHKKIMAACQNGIGTADLYANFVGVKKALTELSEPSCL